VAETRAATANEQMLRQLGRIKKIRDAEGPAPLVHFMEGFAGEEQSPSGAFMDPKAQARDEAYRWGERANLASMIPLSPVAIAKQAPKAARKAKKAVFSAFEGVDDPEVATRMAMSGASAHREASTRRRRSPRCAAMRCRR
jgi:hypothetical protein